MTASSMEPEPMPPADAPTPRPPAIAVFCGSRFGANPAFREAAAAVGQGLAARGMTLIYGGGKVGLMGMVADAAIIAGGRVAGIIPGFLRRREIMHDDVQELEVTDSMHSRKQKMFARADAFLVLPGGLGTFDETFEIVTWRQLGLHDKPILIVNVAGWADALIATIEGCVRDGFAAATALSLYEVVGDAAAALARLQALLAPEMRDSASRDADISLL